MAKPDRERAATWRAWLEKNMITNGFKQVDLVNRSDGAISPTMVSNWMSERSGADSRAVVIAARILHAPVIEALRAAGHHELADLFGPAQQNQEHPAIQRIRNSSMSDEDKEDYIRIIRRRLARIDDYADARIAESKEDDGAA